MNSTILGWEVKINLEDLKSFQITMQYNYDFSYLCSSVRNGDFLSDIPFTIEQDEEGIVLVAKSIPTQLEIATIPVTILNETSPLKEDPRNLDMYATTAFYLILSKYGYNRPNEILSFIGKSKGVASRRTDPIKQHSINSSIKN